MIPRFSVGPDDGLGKSDQRSDQRAACRSVYEVRSRNRKTAGHPAALPLRSSSALVACGLEDLVSLSDLEAIADPALFEDRAQELFEPTAGQLSHQAAIDELVGECTENGE